MTDKKQNEQKDELRDLDVPAEQGEGVKGGLAHGSTWIEWNVVAKPKDPAQRGSS